MINGSRVLLGIKSSGIELVYVNESNVLQARHRISQTTDNIEDIYFFIALGYSTLRFRIYTSTESIPYSGVLSPMSNFVDITHRTDMLMPTSYTKGDGTVIVPVPLVHIFSVWNITQILPNINGVFAYNSYSVHSSLWNSAAVIAYTVTENTYFEFRMDSSANMNHGVGVGFITMSAFEGLPDSSQWVITNTAFTVGGSYMLFQADANGSVRVYALTDPCIQHMAPQRSSVYKVLLAHFLAHDFRFSNNRQLPL